MPSYKEILQDRAAALLTARNALIAAGEHKMAAQCNAKMYALAKQIANLPEGA